MSETEIQVHELSNDPTLYWESWVKTASKYKLEIETISIEKCPKKIRFVCMSDTHSMTSKLKIPIPEGDVFIHAGDFTNKGTLEEVRAFNSWIGKLPHKYKIVIAGNHELDWDSETKYLKNELTNCTYLEDSSTEIHGLKIYGSPYTPSWTGGSSLTSKFLGTMASTLQIRKMAFNLERGQKCLDKWNQIPSNTDILVTHGPPLGFGDQNKRNIRCGCVELLHSVQQRIKPKYHIYGHIHEGYGLRSDGETCFVNAATCNAHKDPCNPAIVFDMDIPAGCSNIE